MNQNERDGNLSLLLADLYQSDELALELLVKYASDPASLSANERSEVEARLARDPSWQDRLRVLQNFNPALILEEQALEDNVAGVAAFATDAAPAAGQPQIAPVVELDRFRAPSVALWLAAAAVTGFVLWNTAFTRGVIVPEQDAPLIVESTDNGLDSARHPEEVVEHIALEETVVPSTVPSTAPSNVPSAEVALVLNPAAATVLPAGHAAENAPETKTFDDALQLAVEVEPEVALPELPLRADEFLVKDDAPLQLAMLSAVHYEAPADRALRTFLGDQTRGTASAVALSAWVPDHVARTASPQPKLYWEIEGQLPEQHTLGFVITSETDAEPLFESSLEAPAESGRQSVDLGNLGVELAEDAIYRWTVFARAPSSDPSEDRIAQGWVQFRAVPASLNSEMLSGPKAERATHYAERGYWYDALALLVGLTEAHPEDAKVQAALAGFLADAGIE